MVVVAVAVVCATPGAASGGFQVVAAAVGAVVVVGRASGLAVGAAESAGRFKRSHGLVVLVVFVVDEDVIALDLDVFAAALGAGIVHLVGAGKSAVGAVAGGVVGVGKVCVSHGL